MSLKRKRVSFKPPLKGENVFNTRPRLASLGKIGVILACLMIAVPLWNLPPTRLGYYSQIEVCLIAFWGFSAASALWLYFLWRKNPRLLQFVSQLPLVWGPLLLGMLTLFLSPFHALPLRDFTGSPHIAEGILTFISSGLMVGHFSVLTRISFYRKIIFAVAFIVGLTISMLTIIGNMESPFISWRYWAWSPFLFPDFLAFVDIALLAIYLYMRQNLKNQTSFICLGDGVAFCLFSLIAYYASNKSLGYGLVIAGVTSFGIQLFPVPWRKFLLLLSFFGLSLSMTLLIAFYDVFSQALPESLKSLGHMTTIMSRTWLSKVTFIDLWYTSFGLEWVQQVLMGKGWGTFANISAANMFLIDQSSLFSGQEYQPSWEIVNRDLLHTHNILTNFFHSLGLIGLGAYAYTHYKLLHSLSRNYFLLGTFFFIAYQIQLLFWFQFTMTLPLTLLALSLFFKHPVPSKWATLLKPKFLIGFASCLLLFTGIQTTISWGYQHGLTTQNARSTKNLVSEFLDAPYWHLEVLLGAQRQVAIARIYATALQNEFEKSPQELLYQSLRLVNYLKSLPRGANYLSNNLAINILSELASKPETVRYLNAQAFQTWEQLAKDHIAIMPYRTDILLPFFNFYQTLGKGSVVLDLSQQIYNHNPNDPLALWFIGSSLLKNPSRFDEALCILQESLNKGIERFMPVPQMLKVKIMQHSKLCPSKNSYHFLY